MSFASPSDVNKCKEQLKNNSVLLHLNDTGQLASGMTLQPSRKGLIAVQG
jgi:hypothetical protein